VPAEGFQFQGKRSATRFAGVIAGAAKKIGEIGLRIEAIEFGGFDQRVHGDGATATGIGAGEEAVLAADGDTARRMLGEIVIEGEAPVIEATSGRGPARAAQRG
jgi:hypothetical protein